MPAKRKPIKITPTHPLIERRYHRLDWLKRNARLINPVLAIYHGKGGIRAAAQSEQGKKLVKKMRKEIPYSDKTVDYDILLNNLKLFRKQI